MTRRARVRPPEALFVLPALFVVFAASPVAARPVPTLHPGGIPEGPDTVVVDYPIRNVPSVLSLRAGGPLDSSPRRSAPGDSSARAGAAPPNAPAPAPASLAFANGGREGGIAFTGLKSVSVEVGKNRSASLEQSLDLTIRGRVAGDVEVAAMLSDKRLPFEPDGSTRELEDLDRIALSVRAPRGEATMGDFVLEGVPGEFARLTRRLEGVRGSASAGGARWNVAAASAKGEKRSLEFRGSEGGQGPYALLTRTTAGDVNGVVSGSETVWLDGIRLKRGADADYVIDYAAGTVTFTVRHPISVQSRIAVDFEAATSRYRRSLYAATTQGGLGDRGSWYASYVSEGDDSKSPLGADLTADDRAVLSQMGDSATTSLPSGVRYAGPGMGSYAWDESDPANPHWIYLGPSRADYEIEFASVGPGRGAYSDTVAADGLRFFRYRGENLGAYVPGRALAVPSSRRLLDLGGSARLFGAVGLEGEVARSILDRNSLSTRDDGDNGGEALRFAARLDPRPLALGSRRLGTLQAHASVRSRGSSFEAFDRLDPSFEGDRWNQRAESGGEDRQELSLQYDPAAPLALRGEVGHRVLSGGSESVRRAAQAQLKAVVGGSLYWEEARNGTGGERGLRSVRGFDLGREKGRVMPRVSAREERIQGQEGDSVDSRENRELQLGLRLAPLASVLIRGGYGLRNGTVVSPPGSAGVPGAEPARTEEQATTWDGGVSARAGAAFSIDGGFTRRRVTTAAGAVGTDLAQLALLAGRPGAPVTSELRYDVTQLREPALVRELRAVAAGSGSYDRFGNPRLGGGYEVVTAAGDLSTRSRATVQLRLDAYPSRAAGAPGRKRSAWRSFGGSSFLRLETLSTLPLGRLTHALDPGAYLAPGSTLRGNLAARQTLEFVPPTARYDARAELGFRRDRTGEIESLQSRRDAFDGRVTVRHPLPAKLRAAASATYDRALQATRRADTGEEYRSLVRGRGYELEISRELRASWSVSLLSRQRRDIDMTHGGLFDTWSVGPTARYAAGARLRLDGRALWGWSEQRGAYSPPGLYVAAPVGSRVDYDFLGEYRVRDRISFALSWAGFKAASRPGFYTGRLELRSAF